MSELRVEEYVIPAARLGGKNPLPPLRPPASVHAEIKVDESVPEEARRYLGYGCDVGILPYRLQDDYDRQRQPRPLRVAVLENEWLRATFLLDLGGRLWSLIHKPTGRELLYRNPVFQPGNLAVRNAWFAGGVEWNFGIRGHTPFTCAPLFAARATSPHGAPILRLYEWERIRQAPYQLDFWLPDGSPFLFARVRLLNPHNREIPSYWWSNIAVTQREDVRVIVPADGAYNFSYAGKFARVAIPDGPGFDATYPTNAPRACDYFFDIPDGRRPWIAALDAEGRGLIQSSTERLRGRKLFVWGMGPGGQRWQEFLAEPGYAYCEIQAGVARTQYECFPMPPQSEISWVEVYGLMEADPAKVHGNDWQQARDAVDERLEAMLPDERVRAEWARVQPALEAPPDEILSRGSGWGALERLRRARAGETASFPKAIPFDDASLGEDQVPWLALLEEGALPAGDPGKTPGAWLVQDEWRALLDEAVTAGRGDHWLSWLHLGVMRYSTGEVEAARQAWERSLALAPSAWALRCLAVLAAHEKRAGDAADLWFQAHALAPECRPLAVECCQALIEAGRPAEALSLVDRLSPELRGHGRVRLLEARAALDAGELDRVESILLGGIEVPDMREGEVALSDLWYGVQERRIAAAEGVPIDDALKERVRRECPPPRQIDFRMAG